MRASRVIAATITPLAAAAITIGTAATAGAELLWPDPTDPYYWDANEDPGSTGPAPLPTDDDLYWKEGQDAGGTGNAPQPSGPEYTDEGPNAGAY